MKKTNKKLLSGIVLPLIIAVVLVSAAVLQSFGMFTFTAEIDPTIKVDGKVGWNFDHDVSEIEIAPGGESFCWLHKVENEASIDIPLDLIVEGEDEGVNIGMYLIPETTTLHLSNKDSSWVAQEIITADLTFKTVNPTFDYSVNANGLDEETDYSLIYYADYDPRFSVWGGDNPGKVIDTFTGSQANVGYSNNVELDMNLPSLDDWNINPSPNYCDYVNGLDDYDHCRGAKLWIVKTSDLTSGNLPLVNWNPSAWLFETDLITYSDCDLYTEYVVDMDRGEQISVLETQSHTMTPMLICYDFDIMSYGYFDINSKLMPVA